MTQIQSFGSAGYGDIPTLETRRLTLRAHRISDLDLLSDIWATQDVVRFVGGKPRSRGDVWKQMQSAIGSWAMLGFGYWAIEDRATGDCIGEIGFLEGLRGIQPSFSGTPEAGWVLGQPRWGQGYASEALSAALRWRDENIALARTVCIIEPDNVASISVAVRNGFNKITDTEIDGKPIGVFERTV